MLLAKLLNKAIRKGTLNVIDTGGKTHRFVGTPAPEVTVRLHSRTLEYRLYINPDLVMGEAYMNGTLTIEQGSLREFLEIVATAESSAGADPLYALRDLVWRLTRAWQQKNAQERSRRNVAHHYDLPDALYDMFLDRDKQYSCAYFEHPDDDLEAAQAAKKRHLAGKLMLSPGQRVLDIGSGWGGLAQYLAEISGAQVTGLTLSKAQWAQAVERTGTNPNVRFHMRDYREETSTYDRIVSVGMFEHVGIGNYDRFFESISDLLTDDGIAVIHTIGRQSGPGSTSPWIRKYIFPGGYSPALSEIMAAVEKSGLWLADVEALRLHYAYTLRAWQKRFAQRRDQIAAMMDERFCRMWEYYLTASEAAFLYGDHLVFQLQLSKKRDAVPLTRGYIENHEQLIRLTEAPARARQIA
jgi:cyclopropane-fatty-acyl-phospholipid synthase